MKKQFIAPTMAAFSAVFFFSTGGLCIKWLSLSALPIAGLRAMVAAVFLGIVLARRPGAGWLPRISRTGCYAAAAYVIMTVSYVSAMKLTTAANAIFLQYTSPIWVLIGGALWLKEPVTRGRIIAIVICLVGMFLFFLDELTPEQSWGNWIAVLAGLGYAFLTLCVRKDRDENPAGAVFWGNAITGLLIVPAALILFPELRWQLADWRTWADLLWLGVFQIGLAYICFVTALKSLPAIEVAILTLVEPVLNPIWVFWVLGEIPGFWAIAGGGMILFSVVLRVLTREEEAPESPLDGNAG